MAYMMSATESTSPTVTAGSDQTANKLYVPAPIMRLIPAAATSARRPVGVSHRGVHEDCEESKRPDRVQDGIDLWADQSPATPAPKATGAAVMSPSATTAPPTARPTAPLSTAITPAAITIPAIRTGRRVSVSPTTRSGTAVVDGVSSAVTIGPPVCVSQTARLTRGCVSDLPVPLRVLSPEGGYRALDEVVQTRYTHHTPL